MKLYRVVLLLAVSLLSACSSQTDLPPHAGQKIGKPYQIYGKWYRPKYDSNYDEVGSASWYGPGFHGGKTANGEKFDQTEFTAAHRTLPLPSIVRVTNLENGKTVLVKINDRGPFSKNRIIDMSQAAAGALGFRGQGTAKVRVQYLEKESREYVANSNKVGMRAALQDVLKVDPVVASNEQERSVKPAFYVMKLQNTQQPPVGAVQVSEEEAVHYPSGDIFKGLDQVQLADASTPEPGGGVSHLASKYYVQAGTFYMEENARKLIKQLEEQNVKILTPIAGNKKQYKVLFGPYLAQDSAENVLSRLASIGIADAKIVKD